MTKFQSKIIVASLIMSALLSVVLVRWQLWARGRIVARSEFRENRSGFDYQYDLTVREIPTTTNPIYFFTDAAGYRYHCEVRFRNRIPATSCTFFFDSYRPEQIRITWPRREYFMIAFDNEVTAECNWHYGSRAVWEKTRGNLIKKE